MRPSSSRFPDYSDAAPGRAEKPPADMSRPPREAGWACEGTIEPSPRKGAPGARARIGRFDDLF